MSLKETGASERAQQALSARVIHLSTNDFGGAGSAALRFHASLLAAGHDSQLFVAESRSSHTVPAVTRVVSELFKVRIKAFARKHLPSKVFSRVRAHFVARERFSAKRKYLFFSVGESRFKASIPSWFSVLPRQMCSLCTGLRALPTASMSCGSREKLVARCITPQWTWRT